MNSKKFEDMMLRFAKELHDVGVTDNMKKIVEDQYTRTPNVGSTQAKETVRKFTYQHEGYMIEAIQNVNLIVKKCN